MKSVLLSLILCVLRVSCALGQGSASSHAVQRIEGLCVDDKRLYTISGRKLHSIDIATGTELRVKDIGADTLIAYKIYKKAVYLYGMVGDSAVKECKKEVRNFRLMNVSYDNQSVFVAILFHTDISGKSRDRYAILQFDTTLTFRNYYIIKPQTKSELSNFPPFQASEFSEGKFMLIPRLLLEDSAKFTHGGYEFRKDRNELIFFYHSGDHFKLPLNISVFATTRALWSPTIYAVPNSASALFYAFPYPYLYDVRTRRNIDPYHLQKKLDSLFLHPDGKSVNVYNERLPFELAQTKEKNIVLATQQIDGQVYMVVSNADVMKTDIVRCDLATREIKILTMDIPLQDYYFVFGNNKLYCLNDGEGIKIKEIDLGKLKF